MLVFCILVLALPRGGESVGVFRVSIIRGTRGRRASPALGTALGRLFSLLRWNSDPSFFSFPRSWRNGKRPRLQMIAGGSSDTQRAEYIERCRMFLAS